MPDQWRGMDLGSAGNRQVQTPHLDRMAGEGVNLVNAVANSPVCTPARSILLTGKYAYATGTAVNDVPLPSRENTIAEILRDRGFYTGFVGKWHLEGGKRMPGFVPPGERRQGFEFWAANICSHDYFNQVYFRDSPRPIRIAGYDAPAWTDLGIELIERAHGRGQPFLLYLQYPTPHDPYVPPPGLERLYDAGAIILRDNWRAGARRHGSAADIAGYYAAIAGLDREIGRLMRKLDELGLRDNTIVVFTSDHGDMLGSHGTFLKRKPWEESIRVPGIVRWPAQLRGGRKLDAPFSHVDVVPTLLGLCGVPKPPGLHGFDYANYLRGQSNNTPELAHIMSHTKTELGEHRPWRGVRTRRHSYARFQDGPWLLYDLARDPWQTENLASAPAYRSLVRKFDRSISERMRRTGDRWDELQDFPYR